MFWGVLLDYLGIVYAAIIQKLALKNIFTIVTSISGIPAAKYGLKWCKDALRQSVSSGSDLWHCLMYSAEIKKK